MDVETLPESEKKLSWFAVNTLSNQELAARERLLQGIEGSHLKDLFGEVIVPTEEVVEVTSAGTRRKTKRRLMPGYMFVQFVMTEETWYLVKNSPKVIGFVGDDKHPRAMRDSDIARLRQGEETAGVSRPKPKQTFEEGANVRVIEGPFLNFSGVVEEVMPQKQKVRVLVSIFGRATPVELDFVQVERA
jgi:transcriptional antiterminator NusG